MMMSLESSSSRCEQLGRQIHIFGRPLSLGEIVANIDAVDRDAVIEVANRLFRGSETGGCRVGPNRTT